MCVGSEYYGLGPCQSAIGAKKHAGRGPVSLPPPLFLLSFAPPQNLTRGWLFAGPSSSCLSILSYCPHWRPFALRLAPLRPLHSSHQSLPRRRLFPLTS